MLNSTLSLYITSIGGSASAAGMVSVVFAATVIFGRTVNGRLCNAGKYRVSAILGLSFCSCHDPKSVFPRRLGARSVSWYTRLRLFRQRNWAATAGASLIAPPSRLGEGLGYIAMFSAIAIAIGPALGLQLIELTGFSGMFFAVAVMCTVAFVLAIFLHGKGNEDALPADERNPPPITDTEASPSGIWNFFLSAAHYLFAPSSLSSVWQPP